MRRCENGEIWAFMTLLLCLICILEMSFGYISGKMVLSSDNELFAESIASDCRSAPSGFCESGQSLPSCRDTPPLFGPVFVQPVRAAGRIQQTGDFGSGEIHRSRQHSLVKLGLRAGRYRQCQNTNCRHSTEIVLRLAHIQFCQQ
jgi:hypothetical protein